MIIKRIMKGYLAKRLHTLRYAVHNTVAQVNPEPVIVLGNQKSGTTVIAALLAEYAGLTATLDFDLASAAQLVRVYTGECAIQAFVRKHKLYFSRDLVKEPGLVFLYPQLAHAFPRARFVMIIRDPRDNIRSILNRLKMPGDHEHVELDAYDEVIPIWRQILENAGLGLGGDTYIEKLALRWTCAADMYLQHRDAMVLVRYEDFVSNKEAVIARLAAQLGLPAVHEIAHLVDRQYQRRGDRHVSWEVFFGPDNLARIHRLCSSRMKALGYRQPDRAVPPIDVCHPGEAGPG